MTVISHSELKCFQRCGQEWHYRYVEKREAREKAAPLVLGLEVHRGLSGTWPTSTVAKAMLMAYREYWPKDKQIEHDVFFLKDIGDDVQITGEVDAIAGGQVREHKTTSEDISPGSAYWRGIIHADPQVSMYLAAFEGKCLEWDVLRKPALRPKKGEDEPAFGLRCLEDMQARPSHYFQRARIVRFAREQEEHLKNIKKVVRLMQLPVTRNRSSCFVYGRPCDFFDVCSGEVDIEDETRFCESEYVRKREVKLRELER